MSNPETTIIHDTAPSSLTLAGKFSVAHKMFCLITEEAIGLCKDTFVGSPTRPRGLKDWGDRVELRKAATEIALERFLIDGNLLSDSERQAYETDFNVALGIPTDQ